MGITFAISDIHGCADKLERLLMRIEAAHDAGTIVFLGDYVDRGPDSAAVLERLVAGPPPQWDWHVLPGNHDLMMLAALRPDADRRTISHWIGQGGDATLASYHDRAHAVAHLDFIESLPLLHRDDHRIYAHAWYDISKPHAAQNVDKVVWTRFAADDGAEALAPLHLVHGHTPSRGHPRTIGHRSSIDHGACYGRPLCAVMFQDDRPGGFTDVMWSD